MREEEQQGHDQNTKNAAVNLDVIAPDNLLQSEIDQRTDHNTERRPQPADQRRRRLYISRRDAGTSAGVSSTSSSSTSVPNMRSQMMRIPA